jgi:hypothetical protein
MDVSISLSHNYEKNFFISFIFHVIVSSHNTILLNNLMAKQSVGQNTVPVWYAKSASISVQPFSIHIRSTARYLVSLVRVVYTEWSRGNACFSHKNNLVDFQDKTFLLHKK